MLSYTVLALLIFDLGLFLASAFFFDKKEERKESLLISVLFFFSGMPALIYQIVWQRVLFAIYGVNAESVAIIVSAFMLGLGLGSLVGGRLSARFPRYGVLIFGIAELGIALFGLASLRIFHWAASSTAGANLPWVIVFSFSLLLVPTTLMGATLPLLVGQLVRRCGRVGVSVSRLYFVNTFGSAVACFLCASFLMRRLGQSGSVSLAVCLNAVVGSIAYLYVRTQQPDAPEEVNVLRLPASGVPPIRLSILMLLAGGISVFLPPLVATLMAHKMNYLSSAPAFFVTAGLLGSALPLLCQVAVPSQENAGRGVSLIYGSNIAGSVLASLGIGFVLMQHLALRQVSLLLAFAAILTGILVLFFSNAQFSWPPAWAAALAVAALVSIGLAPRLYTLFYERLTFGAKPQANIPFAQIVENRNGVIAVTQDGAVFGSGVYDGHFRIDPNYDLNLVVRAFVLSAYNPAPKRMLMIGLSSGSWAQIFVNHPRLESMDIVEINPGYLDLIPRYPVVSSLLTNPRARIYVDDGRRWLIAHPDVRYDAIVANTTFHWRDHTSNLLSREFFQLIRQHLNPGGTYYFNTTESVEALATALSVFPYGLRVFNFLAVSDAPLRIATERWLADLRLYQINGRLVFDPANPETKLTLARYAALAQTVHQAPLRMGLENSDSMRARMGSPRLITDDNMGLEWEPDVDIIWH